jgi:hypothetical protein
MEAALLSRNITATGAVAEVASKCEGVGLLVMLRITIHDQPRVLKIQLEGILTGQWLHELEACWQGAMASQPEPSLLADLTGVTFTDDAGKACLATMHRQGVQFISADCMTNAIVDEIAQSTEQVANKQQDGTEANEGS